MNPPQGISLSSIIAGHKSKISITWLMVIVENLLIALLPLFIGYSIDSLMSGQYHDLIVLTGVIIALVFVAVIRRFYDTRIYGDIRIRIGLKTDNLLRDHTVTTRNARLTMSRELVDFLENDLPSLLTAIIQLIVTVSVLASFSSLLALSAGSAGIIMLAIYALFHRTFIELNAALNTQMERQVNVLSFLTHNGLYTHLKKLNIREIKLSDTEAILYGLVFIILFGFVLTNLMLTTRLPAPTAGQLFSIVTYSLEFVEAAIMLPVTLQTISRLSEISQRLNVR